MDNPERTAVAQEAAAKIAYTHSHQTN